ncbi:hypothetical protein [Pedobacter alpinus]|uniref:Uncharacterized protein n=1 Tax=Pedobacter alpinus TaxID=1590643 RepID=A0ABW5TXA4_9SPHI
MENREEENRKSPQGIEHDYNEHKENPGPSEEAVLEKNEKGAGQAMKWIIPIILVILFIVYMFMRP